MGFGLQPFDRGERHWYYDAALMCGVAFVIASVKWFAFILSTVSYGKHYYVAVVPNSVGCATLAMAFSPCALSTSVVDADRMRVSDGASDTHSHIMLRSHETTIQISVHAPGNKKKYRGKAFHSFRWSGYQPVQVSEAVKLLYPLFVTSIRPTNADRRMTKNLIWKSATEWYCCCEPSFFFVFDSEN